MKTPVSAAAVPEFSGDAPRAHRKVRVLIDALNAKPGQGGLLSYSTGVVQGLESCTDIEPIVLTSAPTAFSGCDVRIVAAPRATRNFVARSAWREAALHDRVSALRPDVVFSTSPELRMRRLSVPMAMIVHDIGPLVAPALYPRGKRLRFQILLRTACASASTIVCLSTNTKTELVRACGIDPSRCVVVGGAGQGLDVAERTAGASAVPFFLVVGSVFGQKNTETLLKAWPAVRGTCTAAGVPVPRLVFAGPLPASHRARFEAAARAHGVENLVEHHGFASKKDLSRLYSQCAALLFPSLYEGLGLPVLEAMEAGIPVISSDLPSIREVGGESVNLISDMTSQARWSSAVLEALFNPPATLARTVVAKERAASYSWEAVGLELARVLRATIDTSPSTARWPAR